MATGMAALWLAVLLGLPLPALCELGHLDDEYLVQKTALREFAATTGWDFITSNCNCNSPMLTGLPPGTGYTTEALCGGKCGETAGCVSFALYTNMNAGFCALFDKICNQDCTADGNIASTSQFGSGYYNIAFNMNTPPGAVGDPHCRNMKGEVFDIRATGEMTMILVPGQSSTEQPDFRLKAVVDHIEHHDACSPTVIRGVKIGGSWLGRGGQEMSITPGSRGIPVVPDDWKEFFESTFAPAGVSVKVVGRRTSSGSTVESVKITVRQAAIHLLQRRGTRSGVLYFDVRVNNITALGRDVGGLLGNDLHDAEAAPSLACHGAGAAARLSAGALATSGASQGMMSVAWAE